MFHFLLEFTEIRVALLAEGVDRNRLMSVKTKLQARVALLAEGVDRNFLPSRT